MFWNAERQINKYKHDYNRKVLYNIENDKRRGLYTIQCAHYIQLEHKYDKEKYIIWSNLWLSVCKYGCLPPGVTHTVGVKGTSQEVKKPPKI